jgi:hypothetical protein
LLWTYFLGNLTTLQHFLYFQVRECNIYNKTHSNAFIYAPLRRAKRLKTQTPMALKTETFLQGFQSPPLQPSRKCVVQFQSGPTDKLNKKTTIYLRTEIYLKKIVGRFPALIKLIKFAR